ncbi:hypothetical protein B484DRAFT_341078 [Ochromonadaceae sp. CCMP2298]|nr:hypothetical protein B484DRAFT_341078 [Ochromonadaceae sp. CCMP2298]
MCAQGTPPAAILMDYEMPVLNGPSATRLLREQGCSCLIIGVTGNVIKVDKDFFISCGADAVFAKPLNADDIMQLLTKIATPRAGAGGTRNKGGAGDKLASPHSSDTSRHTSSDASKLTPIHCNAYSFPSNRVAPSEDASALRPSESTTTG